MLGAYHLSIKKLEKLNINSAKFVPDCLYNYQHLDNLNEKKRYICISDNATIGYAKWDYVKFYKSLITKLQNLGHEIIFLDGNMWKATELFQEMCLELNIKWIHFDNTSYIELAKLLKSSKVLFSGRWHASILATICGTPSVLFSTDSFKTRALHEDLNIQGSFYEQDDLQYNLDEIASLLASIKIPEYKLINFAKEKRNKLVEFYKSL